MQIGLLQFKDLNSDKSAFQRTFANQALLSAFPRVSLNAAGWSLSSRKIIETVRLRMSRCRPVQVKRCDEMLRQLRFFGDIMSKYNVTPMPRAGREKEYHLNELEARASSLHIPRR